MIYVFVVAYALYLALLVLIFRFAVRAHEKWERETAARVYEGVWQAASSKFVDPTRLIDWQKWRTKHKGKLSNPRQAAYLAAEMLNSLKDPYTVIVYHDPHHAAVPHGRAAKVRILDNDILYVKLLRLDDHACAEALRRITKFSARARAVVIDVRDCPGGYLHSALRLSTIFVDSGDLCKLEYRIAGDSSAPKFGKSTVSVEKGKLTEKPTAPDMPQYARSQPEAAPALLTGKPLAVLINKGTTSGGELIAGILRERAGATIFGATTAGKGTCQSTVDLGIDWTLRITTAKFLLPSGHWPGDGGVQKIGVKPDVTIQPTTTPIKDEVLEAASAHLLRKLS